jgi:hypothetical protein
MSRLPEDRSACSASCRCPNSDQIRGHRTCLATMQWPRLRHRLQLICSASGLSKDASALNSGVLVAHLRTFRRVYAASFIHRVLWLLGSCGRRLVFASDITSPGIDQATPHLAPCWATKQSPIGIRRSFLGRTLDRKRISLFYPSAALMASFWGRPFWRSFFASVARPAIPALHCRWPDRTNRWPG